MSITVGIDVSTFKSIYKRLETRARIGRGSFAMTSKQTLAIAIIFACLCCSTLYRVVRYHDTDKSPANEKQERKSETLPVLKVLKGRKQIVNVPSTLSSPRRLNLDTDSSRKYNLSIVATLPPHSKIKHTPPSSPRVKICVCALTRSKPTWKTLDDSRVMKNVIASTHRTTAMEWGQFEVQILLGADADDTFWQRHADALKRQALGQYGLQVTFKFYQKYANFLPFNDLMRDGYLTGSEYLVRINDDTEFTSNGWVSLGVRTLQGFQPPNVGVVGPTCAQGNTKILTHDMVHHTHLHIFKTYYPIVFHNWYLDDWISRVYGPARTKTIQSWTVVHHVEQQGQRYKEAMSDEQSLQQEIKNGNRLIRRYLAAAQNKLDENANHPEQIITYSLYGNNPRYTDGAVANAKLYKTIYPGWQMRVYHDDSVPQKILQKLQHHDVQLRNMSKSNMNAMSWRFTVSDNVARFCARDIDSRLSMREKHAVDEWIASGKKFHVMRDHPSHSTYALSGGMWCASDEGMRQIQRVLKGIPSGNQYMQDMDWLNANVWPIARQSVLQHDSFSCDKFGGGLPFPTPRVGWEHVGSVYINGQMRKGDIEILRQAISPQICLSRKAPVTVQNKDHAKLPICIGLVAHQGVQTLEATLLSYKKTGFLDMSNDFHILFQQIDSPERRAWADHVLSQYPTLLPIFQKENAGHQSFVRLADSCANSSLFFMPLEEDFVIKIDNVNVRIQITNAMRLLRDKTDAVKMRNRILPGEPNYSYESWKQGTLGSTHLLSHVMWDEDAEKHVAEIWQCGTDPKTWCANSKNAHYSNNPTMYNTEFAKKMFHMVPENSISTQKFEQWLTTYWSQQNFQVAHSDGIFTHERLDRELGKKTPTFIKYSMNEYTPNKTLQVTLPGFDNVPILRSATFTVSSNVHKNKNFWSRVQAGKWEIESFQVIRNHVKPESTYIGFGAWIGPLALAASLRTNKIYVLEPDPVAYETLNKNIHLNNLEGTINAFNMAFGKKKGMSKTISGRLGPGDSMTQFENDREGTIKTTTFQLFVSEHGIGFPLFIKHDCEGCESWQFPILTEWANVAGAHGHEVKVWLSLHGTNKKSLYETDWDVLYQHGSTVLLRNRVALHTIQEIKKNVVMAAALGYGLQDFQNFILPLRAVSDDDIVLFVTDGISKEIKDLCNHYGVTTKKLPSGSRLGVKGNRYIGYAEICQNYHWCFATDFRDVFFQDDPFKSIPAAYDLILSEEFHTVSISKCPYNSKWIQSCWGNSVLSEIGFNIPICSGTILGNSKGFQTLKESMLTEMQTTSKTTGCEARDQGHLNYLYYTQKIKVNILVQPRGKGIVNTIGYITPKNTISQYLNVNGNVVNDNGIISPVVHQYDRFPEVVSALKALLLKVSPIDQRINFITNKQYLSLCDAGFRTRSRNDLKLPVKSDAVLCVQGTREVLDAFFKLDITTPFTLVSIESDESVPQNIKWLENKYLQRWYSWNSVDNRVTAIPIGLNHDSQLDAITKANPAQVKYDKILLNFKQDTKERKDLFHKVKDLDFVHVEPYKKKWENVNELKNHYEAISKYKWVLCPRGAGQDTHRVWEALYLGSVPVVLKSPLSQLYQDLPIIQLNNWDELSWNKLQSLQSSIPKRKEKASFDYWIHRIKEKHTADTTDENGMFTMFFQTKICHPGRTGKQCTEQLNPANPWYVEDCPNLRLSNSLNLNVSLQDLRGRESCHPPGNSMGLPLSYCAYLCYAHPLTGVAVIPFSIWKAAQVAEAKAWNGHTGSAYDVSTEHIEGFEKYSILNGFYLGDVIEVGAGPWTQTRAILDSIKSENNVKSFTIHEPLAEFYKRNTPACAYKSGKLAKIDGSGNYAFPVTILGERGETLTDKHVQYDTLVAMNVIEHVQNAYEYLEGLYKTIKPGGLLIFHERFFENPVDGDKVLGRNLYHPIRITRFILDIFLQQFDIVMQNENPTSAMIRRNANEHGYYVIARKKTHDLLHNGVSPFHHKQSNKT